MEMLGFKTWPTVNDILVFASFLLFVTGVFAAPVRSYLPVDTAARLFGSAFVGFRYISHHIGGTLQPV